MSRMINDLGSVRMMIGMGVLSFTSVPVNFFFSLIVMISLSPRLSARGDDPVRLLFFVMRWLTRTLMARSLGVQEGLAAIGAKAQESLSGIHVVKAYTLEDHEANRFRAVNDEYNEQGLALARLRGALMPIIKGTVGTLRNDRFDLRRDAGARQSDLDWGHRGLHGLPRPTRVADGLVGLDSVALPAWPRPR